MENESLRSRIGRALVHGWNAFQTRDPTYGYVDYGASYSYRPDRPRMSRGNEKSFVTSIFNRIALDVASFDIKHCQLDKNGRYLHDVDSYLNECLTLEANLDQTAKSFIHDVALSMFDEGVVAMVPIDTTFNPKNGAFDIESLRTGKILEWYPKHVKVQVYNDRIGEKRELVLPKSMVGIVENPFYAVMNEPNSTVQRLIRKLNLLDFIDEQSGSGKLDLIIQLPYTIKSESRRKEAEKKHKDIEMQLTNSKHGIAYIDSAERITQLNRPVENNLLKQIEFLTNMAWSQLNITQAIMDGTADDKAMTNYLNRTVEPVVSAIVDEMKRKFLTKTARSQKKTIRFFRDIFKFATIDQMATAGDTFTRNEIMSKNEVRDKMGMPPSSDPKADQLINSNISQPTGAQNQPVEVTEKN